MKKTIKIFALSLFSAALFSCQDAALPAIDNMVYISDAANGRIGTATMAEGDTEVSFSVRLARAAEEDIKVSIRIDESVLNEYNSTFQASFKHVPADSIAVPASVMIPAGAISSEPVTIVVKPFDTKGAQYAVSFRVDADGNVPVADESSKYIIQLLKPLKQLVPKLSVDNAIKVEPMDDWGYELMNYTLEWWCKMIPKWGDNAFSTNNQAVINSGNSAKGCELYIRYGDVIYGYGPYNYLQIKTMGGQFDTGNPAEKGLKSNQWYHYAISYDGNTGESILYLDGQVVSTLNTGAGRPMCIDSFELVQGGMFENYAEMCQVRLWKTTRSASQIEKNMRSEVEYSNPDLLMYLPMNEGPGATVFNDVTGNNHTAALGSHANGNKTEAFAWTEYAF